MILDGDGRTGAVQPVRWMTGILLCALLAQALPGCARVAPRAVAGAGTPAGQAPATTLAVVVSGESPAFVDVARSIAAQTAARPPTYNLKGDPERAPEVLRDIQASNATIVVAIGSVAATAARRLSGKRVVFCQVFDYELADLVTPWMHGVDAVPPLAQAFHEWKLLDPKLARVGVISGDGLGDLMREARAAADAHGVHMTITSVNSDKEMLYAYKRMSPHIDGLWLVPDSRVLSGEVLRDLMAYSVKRGMQVMVFAPELLRHGGLISVESDPQDVATQVLARVRELGDAAVFTGPAVTRLTRARITVNSTMARQLGLRAPAGFSGR